MRYLWDIKHKNISIEGVPGEKERKQGIKNLFEEIMTENYSNQANEMDTQIYLSFTNYSKKIQEKEKLPSTSNGASNLQILKPDKNIIKKDNYRPIFLMDIKIKNPQKY